MRRLASFVVAAALLAGCGNEEKPATVAGTVNLAQYELAPPEIPAQENPYIIEGKAVQRPSGEDAFYKDGDEVTILCRVTNGELYPDPSGESVNRRDWYRIVVTHLVPGYLQAAFVDPEDEDLIENC